MSENIIGPSSKGPYDSSTQAGKGANAGFNVLQSITDGSIFGKNIKYKDGSNDDYTFGYSEVTLKSMDSDGDNKITAKDQKWQDLADIYNNLSDKSMLDQSLLTDGKVDAEKIFNKFDVNQDGEYDAGEDAAYSKLQDKMAENPYFIGTGKANDGVLTQDEIDYGCTYMMCENTDSDEKNEATKSKLATIYDDDHLEEKYERFKETGTSVEKSDEDNDTKKSVASANTVVNSQHGHNILKSDSSKDIFNQSRRTLHGHTISKTNSDES